MISVETINSWESLVQLSNKTFEKFIVIYDILIAFKSLHIALKVTQSIQQHEFSFHSYLIFFIKKVGFFLFKE